MPVSRKHLPILLRLLNLDPASPDLLKTVYVGHPLAETGADITRVMLQALVDVMPQKGVLSRALKTIVSRRREPSPDTPLPETKGREKSSNSELGEKMGCMGDG